MPDREQWIDAIKGMLIVLVVLHHALDVLLHAGYSYPGWAKVDAALTPVRMPLFFLLAGLFAASSLRLPARRFWREKVGRFGWLYLVWGIAYVAYYTAGAVVLGDPVADELAARCWLFATVETHLWFIAALGLGFGTLRITRVVPAGVALAIAGLVSMSMTATVWLPRSDHASSGLLIYPFWFLLGCHVSALVRTVARQLHFDWLGRHWTAAPWKWIGRRTLPIYLLHVGVLSIVWTFPGALVVVDITGPTAPAIATAVGILGALVFSVATRSLPGLYDLPRCSHFKAGDRVTP